MSTNNGDSDNGNGTTNITLNIRCANSRKFSVQTKLDSSVAEFKQLLAKNTDVPVEYQRLIYKGKILIDDQTLEFYGLQSDHTVHMVRGLVPASTNTTGVANGGATNTIAGVPRSIDPVEGLPFTGGGLHTPLLPDRFGGGGVPGLFGTRLSEFEQVQEQLTRNPSIMRIMDMAGIQNLMNHPDLIHSVLMNIPQMREAIVWNPELAHILNHPSTLQRSMEAAMNPELRQEMMRHNDRDMGNIENSLDAFDMLRRVYETVQEPLLNTTTMTGNRGDDTGSSPYAAVLGNHGGAQTRDQSTNPSTTGSEASTGSQAPNTNPLPNPWSSASGAQRNTVNSSRNSWYWRLRFSWDLRLEPGTW